jgi:hypothetical protein
MAGRAPVRSSCCRHVRFVTSIGVSVESGLLRFESVEGHHQTPDDSRAHSGPRRSALRRAALLGRDRSVALACLATVVVHLMSLSPRLGLDEGGLSTVARFWTSGGKYLYGPQWVDRPPGLIAVFAVADRLGPFGARLVATALAAVLVASVASSARSVGGVRAARWAAWVGFALACSVLLRAQQLNGELVAATAVAVSVALILRAFAPTARSAVVPAIFAGVAASSAVLIKQNFVDAIVFIGVLIAVALGTSRNRRRFPPRQLAVVGAGAVAGMAVPVVAVVWWAVARGELGALGYAMYGFRADAADVMASWSWAAPLGRLGLVLLIAGLSGLGPILIGSLWVCRGRIQRLDPVAWALVATAGTEIIGIVAGLNFWSHYLIALIPMTGIAAGLAATSDRRGARLVRWAVAAAVAVTAVVSPIAAAGSWLHDEAGHATGRWIATAAHPGDSIVVPFTHADVIYTSGLRPAYPYNWSLPVRTLDPHLTMFVNRLSGTDAPTWVVQWSRPHQWGLDPHNHVPRALHAHYRRVATTCGQPVWLHRGLLRTIPKSPARADCGPGFA